MNYRGVTHVALRVARLREAEEFYRALFGVEVAFREAEAEDGWRTLPEGVRWEEAEAAGILPGLSVMHRKGFTLALEAADEVPRQGVLHHIGLEADSATLDQLRQQAFRSGCRFHEDLPDVVVLVDPYGVQWEVTSLHEDDPRRQSQGARRGRWLDVRVPKHG